MKNFSSAATIVFGVCASIAFTLIWLTVEKCHECTRHREARTACAQSCVPYVFRLLDDACYCLQADGSYEPVALPVEAEKTP